MSQTKLSTLITGGIIGSLSLAVFMTIFPQMMGIGAIDITKNLGVAFSNTSPYVAGGSFLALLGVLWSVVFVNIYNTLPGNAITKGAVFGLIVGLFSLAVLPEIMTTIDGIIGQPGQYSVAPFTLDNTAIISLIAYMGFGLVLSYTNRPANNTTV